MSESPLKLPRNADELLRDFPMPDPDFEAQAKAIEARFGAAPADADVDWLKPPLLDPEPGEPAAPSSTRAAPKMSLAEMARRSVQKKEDTSEIDRDLLVASAQNRRPNAELVERVRAAARSAASATPLPATGTPLPATGTPLPTRAEEAGRASGVVALPTPAARAAGKRGVALGVIGGALALAACVALFLRGVEPSKESSVAAQPSVAASPVAATQAVGREQQSPPTAKDGIVSPEALAEAPLAPVASPAAPRSGSASPGSVALAAKATPTANGSAKPLAVVLEEDRSTPRAEAPVAEAEPTTEPQLKPAEGNTGSVPLNPSAGAISTALNGVRASAQACLAGQTDSVRAVVTFAADGHVLRVSADGPAGPCIKAALAKAHIAPFARESFAAPTTIRPP